MWHMIRKFATEELMQLKWNPSSSFAPPVKPRHDLDDINTELDRMPPYVLVYIVKSAKCEYNYIWPIYCFVGPGHRHTKKWDNFESERAFYIDQNKENTNSPFWFVKFLAFYDPKIMDEVLRLVRSTLRKVNRFSGPFLLTCFNFNPGMDK